MTDWDLIVEHIQNAMQAVDQAHEASENLRNQATPETFDEFQVQMQELCEHLSALKNVMEHTSTYTMDVKPDVQRQTCCLSPHTTSKFVSQRKTR